MDSHAFEKLEQAVFSKQTVLADIFRNSGHKNLYEYVQGWIVTSGNRHLEIVPILENHVRELYGIEAAQGVAAQFAAEPLVSSIDHHGLLNHPFFINSNLIFSLRKQRYLICLPTAGVSLNNNTSWSGCLLSHGRDNAPHRFSFFPDRVKTCPVLATKAFDRTAAERVFQRVSSAEFMEPLQRSRLSDLVQEIFLNDDRLYAFEDFSRQAAYGSRLLWNTIFPDAPQLVYVPLERLVTDIIRSLIIPNPGHILHALFFTADGWDIIEKTYCGTLGAFAASGKGSFLFWGINEKGRRVHLVREGTQLKDHGFTVGNGKKALGDALGAGSIYPTSLTCFLVLLYYGVTCLGGFNQVNWLTAIRDKFASLVSAEAADLGHAIASVPANNFAEGNLAYLSHRDGLIKPTGMDIYANGKATFTHFEELAKRVTVGESIQMQLPEIYRVIIPAEHREPDLLSITEEEIFEYLGMKKNLTK